MAVSSILMPAERSWNALWNRAAGVDTSVWRSGLYGLALCLILFALWQWMAWWFLAPSQSDPATFTVAQPSSVSKQVISSNQLEGLFTAQLFGAAPPPEVEGVEAATLAEAVAETTRLALSLDGIMHAPDPAHSRAVIGHDNQQHQYRVGERLEVPGEVSLEKVLADRVIIKNAGRLESLWLYDPDAPRLASSSVASNNNAAFGDGGIPVPSGLANPRPVQRSLLQVFDISPARNNGQLSGYRVKPAADPQPFLQLGLRPGDVITHVNQTPLNNPREALEMYNLLRTSAQATLTVQRDGRELVLEVKLDDPA